jgi:tRNA pseudouridine38-40 synthase
VPTYRADIEYEGTRYRGWQVQANARSVAGELHRAIAAAGGSAGEIGGSGRTDAGVHALRQTAHVRLQRAVDADRFRRAVNDALPPDIHILELREAAARFHARHDAVARSYLYQIALRRSGLAKRFVWWVREPFDVDRAGGAAALLSGRHDFRAFCERPSEQPSTIVVVERVEVARAGDLVLVRFVASHFLWKMVRRLVGALARAGTGELSPQALEDLVAGRAEAPVASWTAPPSGLFLERVLYPGEAPLGPLAPAFPVPRARLAEESR